MGTLRSASCTPPVSAASHVDHDFISRARGVLTGAIPAKGLLGTITHHSTNGYINDVLSHLAETGNSTRPVAARLQSRPENMARLIQDDTCMAVGAARHGAAYRFSEKPHQYRRPKPFKLDSVQERAALTEIQRLYHKCGAIELAPEHDGDRALRPGAAKYELQPMPHGQWPRERPVPVLYSPDAVERYNRAQMKQFQARVTAGKPLRDFESGVFVVGKSDGGYRLCTDFRALNKFSVKTKFQMEGVQEVSELIQRNDYGMLIDLKDCYLTLGLHPSHRKYTRFRSPDGTRFQWKTVSFGASEAPRICTKILRPIIRILKSLGVRCLIYLDDLLILHQDRVQLAKSMAVAMELLQHEVGLQLKLSKGQLTPSQRFQCLGVVWDTKAMTCHIPLKRMKALQSTALRLLRASGPSTSGKGSTILLKNDDTSVSNSLPNLKVSSASPAVRPVFNRDLGRFLGQVVSTMRAIRPVKRRLC